MFYTENDFSCQGGSQCNPPPPPRLFVLAFIVSSILAVLIACTSDENTAPAPGPTADIPATVDAQVAKALDALPTPAPTLTPAPTPTLTPAPTPTLTPAPTPAPSGVSDREALVILYNATGGPQWDNNENWLSDRPLEEWHGVVTDDQGQVTRLLLLDNDLTGPIPPELGNLPNLVVLSLGDNDLTGPIPPELGNLANLETLELSSNDLTGEIPPELGNLSNLITWFIGGNQLTGPIPPELAGFSSLVIWVLSGNELEGELPSSITELSKLQLVEFSDNARLCAPPSLEDWLQRIVFQEVHICEDTAMHPDYPALEALYYATGGPQWDNNENWLTDAPLDEWYGVGTDDQRRVFDLDLRENNLTGELPPELGNLSGLEVLYLFGNQLTGELAQSLTRLTHLREFDFDDNAGLCAPRALQYLGMQSLHQGTIFIEEAGICEDPASPDTDRAALTSLYHATGGPNWHNNENWLIADAPLEVWYGVSTDNQGRVRILDLRENNLTRTIPPELGDLSNLRAIDFSGNRLTGELPQSLTRLTNLIEFEFHDNAGLCAPPALQDWLQGFEHSGPNCGDTASPDTNLETLLALCEVTVCLRWDNHENWFTDAPLGEWYGVSTDDQGRVTELRLEENNLIGWIPPELGNLPNLRVLRLDGNNLTGELPQSLTRLTKQQILLFGGNAGLCAPPALQDWLQGVDYIGPNCADTTAIPDSDREALVALYNATDGPRWNNDENWLSDRPLGEWYGVVTIEIYNEVVDKYSYHVAALVLADNNLTGELPPELGNLSQLQHLLLEHNNLTGELPPELGNLPELQLLRLDVNNLTGELPPELGNLSELRHLSLYGNVLTGELPQSLTRLERLEFLLFDGNAGLCAPESLQDWLQGREYEGPRC